MGRVVPEFPQTLGMRIAPSSLWELEQTARVAMMTINVVEKFVSNLAVTPTCPHCKHVIPSEDVNVANDIAFCRNCNLTHRLSSLALGVTVDPAVDISRPPKGTWFQRDGSGVRLGATHRSLGQALGLLFVSLFWNGIVSVFVCLAAASTLQHLGIPLPHWFPAPNSKGSPIPVGFTLFLWLFLTPFIAVGVAMLAGFLSALAGHTELRIQGGELEIFSGIGPIGFRKRVTTSQINDVRIDDRRWRDSDGDSRRQRQIVIETNNKPIKFGSSLTEERRQFVAAALLKELPLHR
jgi:hypothetical protein